MMKVGRGIFFARLLYDRPGTFAGNVRDHSDPYYELLVINSRVLVLNVFDTLHIKIRAIFECHSGPTGSFTSFPVGKQVDGLPRAFNKV